jgi:[ribosomal protein S18]-alanine N-acetyltransferase
MKTLIRLATSADFETLLTIDAASFEREIAYDSAELSFLMKRPGAETFVLEEEGAVAAFLLMEVNRRRRRATLVTLDVRSERRRHGLATDLLRHSEIALQGYGVGTYDLQVDVRNEGAVAFYRKHGFEVSRRLKKYYPGGHDAWEMVKTLPKSAGG